jgi:PAS domain S-box-containing protein
MGASWSTDRWNAGGEQSVRVLHLDDEPSVTDLTATFLEREYDYLDVETANDETAALDRFEDGDFDCVVSDYDMNRMTGLEFLDAIRNRDQDLPFILFTGKGSEEIASEAISRGVTDYLQKTTGTNQYRVLANRITNVVDQYRTKEQIEAASRWYSNILEHSSDYVMIVDDAGTIDYVSPAITRVMGYDPDEIVGTNAFDFVYPADIEAAIQALSNTMTGPDDEVAVEFRAEHADGSIRWLEARGRDFLDDPVIDGVMVNVRDVTTRKEREQTLETQTEMLGDLTGFLSADVQSALATLDEQVDRANDACETEHLTDAADSVDRIQSMLDTIMDLARPQPTIADRTPIDLGDVALTCWEAVEVDGSEADVTVETEQTVAADPERLRTLFENLFRNAVAHAGPEVSVTVGDLPAGDGFYVADDGPGIPRDERESVFEIGHAHSDAETGIGLAVVDQIASAHGWTVRVTDSSDEGARFEISDVDGQ